MEQCEHIYITETDTDERGSFEILVCQLCGDIIDNPDYEEEE